ncbi:piggyBac transposable element-derived protein 3-like [Scylla paramamosain]|uniref:piggyBac transposable element-derived protein 3-like n=1 Tax=Scylla paramamosain TaxID=85552 RepID=UPI0030834043
MSKLLSLAEAVALVLEEDGEEINILPPEEDQALTDEENIDDNLLEDCSEGQDAEQIFPRDVCGRVEVADKLDTDERPTVSQGNDTGSEGNNKKRMKKAPAKKVSWKKCKNTKVFPQKNKINQLEEDYPNLCSLSPGEMFLKLFNNDIQKLLVQETLRYAHEKCNNPKFTFDTRDLLDFIGIFILSGYHKLPREDMYWERSDDVAVPVVSRRMSINRFREIKRYFHAADNNNLNKTDKMSKVRPMIEATNKSLQQFGIFCEHLSIDECMVPYFGHHSCKMFIRGKPIRFGYKLWCLCSSTGYPYKFDVYCGKSLEGSNTDDALGTRVVEQLMSCVNDTSAHKIFFDNFFTSHDLMLRLQEHNTRATGTARDNRLLKCPLPESNSFKKTKRGTYEYFSDGNILAVKWNDNRPVTVVTNYDKIDPVVYVERWSVTERKKIRVQQPNMIQSYNKFMGGVDLMDRFVAQYRPSIRSKKWYFPILFQMFNMLRIAAWLIHREVSDTKLDQLEFTRSVVRFLFSEAPARNPSLAGPSGHHVHMKMQMEHVSVSSTKQGRCRYCKKNTRMMCSGCNVLLHTGCLKMYHEA